jgi:predicted DNA-binding transcriptional regulator AlpA
MEGGQPTSLPEELRQHPNRMLTLEQTAEFIIRSKWEIRRLVALGKFPKPRKPGGHNWTFLLGELIEHLNSR